MIYLDNNATTPVAPEVFEAMRPFLVEEFGNPSSAHASGRAARKAVEAARAAVATLLGAADPSEIVFTSCGSESDNWAIHGALNANQVRRHVITTRVEHEAVRGLCEQADNHGFQVTWLEVDSNGELDLDDLRRALRPDTALVSIMLANNETGVLFPIDEIGRIIRQHSDALFHVDGVQAVGKIPIRLGESPVDLFSLSGHKFYAPKGIGALYIRRGVKLSPLITGGGQEHGRRSGTESVPNIVALGRAAELAIGFEGVTGLRALRDRLEDTVLATFPNARLNGTTDRRKRLPNTANISFVGHEGATILAQLDAAGICVSTGSACKAESGEVSAVLRAMNVPADVATASIRFSLGRYNTEDEINQTIETLTRIIPQ